MQGPNPFSGIKTYTDYRHLWLLTALVILLQIAVSAGVTLLERHFGVSLGTFGGFLPALLVTGYISWSVLAGLGVSWRGALAGWRAGAGRDLLKALLYFLGYAVLLAGIAAALYAGYYLLGDRLVAAMRPLDVRNTAENLALYRQAVSARPSFLLALISACVVAPAVEETFFRRIVYTTIRLKNGFWASAFWSGLLFALFHGEGAPIIFPVGVYLAWVYERERRLSLNIMLHVLINVSMISLKVLIK